MVRAARSQPRASVPARAERSSARLYLVASSETHTLRHPFTHGDKTQTISKGSLRSRQDDTHSAAPDGWPTRAAFLLLLPVFVRDILA